MSRASVVMLSLVIMVFLSASTITLPRFSNHSLGYLGRNIEETKILFVGDVMLGRYVETIIAEKGAGYPFIGLASLTDNYDQIIGNFEAPLSLNHEQTEARSFNFSVATSSITSLSSYFSALSLANNHTFDKGFEDLQFTRQTLQNESITVFGDPNQIGTSSVTFIPHGEQIIALMGINVFSDIDLSSTQQFLTELNRQSDMQIIYVHWGDEYQTKHNTEQENLARFLIEAGADAVIGHHPHVVQDIDIYKGAPIFYSLGNFIFDQYFDDDVQIGLGVELVIRNSEVAYRLIPFTARETKSSPRLMNVDERNQLLSKIRSNSSPAIAEKLKESGIIHITEILASL